MTLSDTQRKALEIMSDGETHGGAMFGYKVFGDEKKNGGTRAAQGAGRIAGGLLAKMAQAGLVERWGDAHSHSRYRITRAGRAALGAAK